MWSTMETRETNALMEPGHFRRHTVKKTIFSFFLIFLFLFSAFFNPHAQCAASGAAASNTKNSSSNQTNLTLSLSNPHPPYKTPAAVTVTVTAQNIGNQTLNISLSDSDTTGNTTLSSPSLTLTPSSPSASTTLNYNGEKLPLPGVTITAAAGEISTQAYFMPEGENFRIPLQPQPYSIAIDAAGNVWVTGYSKVNANCPSPFFWVHRGITEINPSGKIIRTVSPTWESCSYAGAAIDKRGNIWVTSNGEMSVVKLSPSGATLGTYNVGMSPHGIAIDAAGNIWVAGVLNRGLFGGYSGKVVKLSPTGKILGTFSVGKDLRNLAISASGDVWVTDHAKGDVIKLSPTGAVLGTFKVGMWPEGITTAPSGSIWVTNFGSFNVTELSSSGAVLGTFNAEPVGLNEQSAGPHRVAVDDSGNVWVGTMQHTYEQPNSVNSAIFSPIHHFLMSGNNLIKFNAAGTPLGSIFAGTGIQGMAIDRYGNVWVTNRITNVVSVITGAASSGEFFPYQYQCQTPCHSSPSAPQWP